MYTTGYNCFTGWDWIINQDNIALGVAKAGPLRNFQHKIHYFDEEVGVSSGGEFFCDPDDILFLPQFQNVSYLPYLNWEKDLFVNNERTFARLSFVHNSKSSFIGDVSLDRPPRINIRIDKSLGDKNGFVDSRVYLTNNYATSTDIVYITQDAAYMFLPEKTQKNVKPLLKVKQVYIKERFYFSKLNKGDMV